MEDLAWRIFWRTLLLEDPALEDLALEDPAYGGPCFWRTLLLEDLALKDLALEDPALEDLALVDRGIKVDYLNTQLHR